MQRTKHYYSIMVSLYRINDEAQAIYELPRFKQAIEFKRQSIFSDFACIETSIFRAVATAPKVDSFGGLATTGVVLRLARVNQKK